MVLPSAHSAFFIRGVLLRILHPHLPQEKRLTAKTAIKKILAARHALCRAVAVDRQPERDAESYQDQEYGLAVCDPGEAMRGVRTGHAAASPQDALAEAVSAREPPAFEYRQMTRPEPVEV